MVCAHYIPFRAIRAGKQLSDSKGASAAISTEAAILSMKRAMNGFVGPKDIFRNPEAIWRLNEPTNGDSPFNIVLSNEGDDFASMSMHFKLGLYEHQSAGAIQAVLEAISQKNILTNVSDINQIEITAYQPAFGIIGDPAKKNPTTRQSADHSMAYIIATLIRKAISSEKYTTQWKKQNPQKLWIDLMLEPKDYGKESLFNPLTREIMQKINFVHGGPQYDSKYPEGIPTKVVIKTKKETVDSGMVMFPGGHANNKTVDLEKVLNHKFNLLGELALPQRQLTKKLSVLRNLENLSNKDLQLLYNCSIQFTNKSIDE